MVIIEKVGKGLEYVINLKIIILEGIYNNL